MIEKRYILDLKYKNEINKLFYSMNGKKVKDKDVFFNKPNSNPNMVYEKGCEFNYLIPESIEVDEGEYIMGDIHDWIGEEPDIYSFPISKKLKEILEQFNLNPNKFYDAKVLYNEEYLQYYVWQLFLNGFDTYIDLENSTFCEWKHLNKHGEENIKINSQEEIDNYSYDNNWRHYGFNKAIMKPEFRDIDCCYLPHPYGIVISERLRNALKIAQPALTGFEIIECPIEFEYLE